MCHAGDIMWLTIIPSVWVGLYLQDTSLSSLTFRGFLQGGRKMKNLMQLTDVILESPLSNKNSHG